LLSYILITYIYNRIYIFTINGCFIFEIILFSEFICSTCFNRTISDFFITFIAKKLSDCRNLVKNTLPNVPVPDILFLFFIDYCYFSYYLFCKIDIDIKKWHFIYIIFPIKQQQ